MRLTCKLSGDGKDILLKQWKAQTPQVQDVIRRAAVSLQSELRGQARDAGLGNALANAWRVLPPDNKFKWTALVFSKAVRLHEAFDSAETVLAKGGSWLALPTEEAVRLGLAINPSKAKGGNRERRWSNVDAAIRRFGELRFVPLRGGRGLLVTKPARARLHGKGIPLFLLVRSVHRRKLLDLEGATARAFAKLKTDLARVLT